MRSSALRWTVPFALVALAAAAAWWLARDGGGGGGVRAVGGAPEAPDDGTDPAPAPLDDAGRASLEARADTDADGATPDTASGEGRAADTRPAGVPVLVRRLGSDGRPVEVASADVRLGERSARVEGGREARVADVLPGRHELHVDAPGFHHAPETVVLAIVDLAPLEGDATYGWIVEPVLLRDAEVAVVVTTPDGRPFIAHADDRGWEHRRLF